MKVLVISDTHRYLQNAEDIIKLYGGKINTVIHLGDLVNDVKRLSIKFGNINFYNVSGNNDYDSSVPYEKMITLEEKNFF